MMCNEAIPEMVGLQVILKNSLHLSMLKQGGKKEKSWVGCMFVNSHDFSGIAFIKVVFACMMLH